MKKYVVAVVAVLLAVGLYSFVTVKKDSSPDPETFYWYSVDSGLGDENTYSNGDVTFLAGPLEIDEAPDGGCTASTNHKCVIGFSSTQLNTSTHVLNPNQTPMETKSTRVNP